jgi:integrase
MGRRREQSDPDEPLPRGLFKHWRQYRARDIDGKTWRYFGTDYADAVKGYKAWQRDGCAPADTVAWLLDFFCGVVCPASVKAGNLAARTAKDYSNDAEVLKAGLGKFKIRAVRPIHIAEFRDARAPDAPRHVRNELACLSAAFAFAVEKGYRETNPCHEVRRPRKERRERLITDAEYLTVYGRAGPMVRRAMVLALRTLALPADLLAMGPRNIIRLPDGRRLLRYERGKIASAWVEIEVVGELAQVIDEALSEKVVCTTFVHRRNGKPFTRDGLGAMFRRHCVGSPTHAVDPLVEDFGLRDLRAKGATEMFRADANGIRRIQLLLGHKSVRTTEIYLKGLVPETVRPNEQPVIARM